MYVNSRFLCKQQKDVLWASPSGVNCPQTFSVVNKKGSQVRLGSTIDWNSPELSPHAQVLSDNCHQRHAGYIDEPPRQGSWKMSVIDPAANHMEKVHSDCEVEALLPSTNEEPQAKGAASTMTRRSFIISNAWLYCTLLKIRKCPCNVGKRSDFALVTKYQEMTLF